MSHLSLVESSNVVPLRCGTVADKNGGGLGRESSSPPLATEPQLITVALSEDEILRLRTALDLIGRLGRRSDTDRIIAHKLQAAQCNLWTSIFGGDAA